MDEATCRNCMGHGEVIVHGRGNTLHTIPCGVCKIDQLLAYSAEVITGTEWPIYRHQHLTTTAVYTLIHDDGRRVTLDVGDIVHVELARDKDVLVYHRTSGYWVSKEDIYKHFELAKETIRWTR